MQKIKFRYHEIAETTVTLTQEEVCRLENYMRNNPSISIANAIAILMDVGVIGRPSDDIMPDIYINEIDVDNVRVLSSDSFTDIEDED